MNLTLAEISELPLVAALIDADGAVIARTPEWDGTGPGAVSYPVRSVRLVVRTLPASEQCDAVLSRLLKSIDGAALALSGTQAKRVRMLAGSLRLVAGREPGGWGTTDDVIDLARAGITARTGLSVEAVTGPARPVLGPQGAALVLVQLAVNAERHDRARAVRLEVDRTTFRVVWRHTGPTPRIATSRRRAERDRWGLGFARIAADAIGGTVYPPRATGDGMLAATLELGIRRLALPLAAVRDGRVCRATRSWDEETGLAPGSAPAPGSKLATIEAAAGLAPGRIVAQGGFSARGGLQALWVAVPPDDSSSRARDVVSGLIHERSLSDHVEEPARSTIGGLALLLATLLGDPMPRVPIAAWRRRMLEVGAAFGIDGGIPHFDGVGAIDPQVVAVLAPSSDGFEVEGERLWLRIREECRDDAAVRVLLRPGEDRIPLG
ncbi:MAG: hypothetical protein WB793_06065 [Candidatus Dormiibacterota bacterium]